MTSMFKVSAVTPQDYAPVTDALNKMRDVVREHAARFACAVEMAYAQGCAECGAPPMQLQTVGGAGMWTSWPGGACKVEMSEQFRLVCDRHADNPSSTRGNIESTQTNTSATQANTNATQTNAGEPQ